MSSSMSIGGLISGIDTNTMLDQLYQAAQTPILRLRSRKEALGEQSVAWSQLEAKLLGFRSLAARLASPAGFQCYSGAVSRPELAAASVGPSAVPGGYTFTVLALAQTHQLASQGYADTDQTEVGTGTVSISVGDGEATEIAVEGLTLGELRDAINRAEAGVTATIMDDGNQDSPYRLVLASGSRGSAGEMAVSVELSGGAAPVLSEIQAAQDAQLRFGSGAGAVTIYSSTGAFSNVIQGVTLTVLAADPETPVTLSVLRDTASVRGVIEDLVKSYNEAVDFVAQQFAFDPEASRTGTLFGNYRLQGLQQELAAALGSRVIGLSGSYASLSGLGLRTDGTGKLSIEAAVLADALANHFDEVVSAFSARGTTTHSAVTYLTSSVDTRPSGATGWEIEVTQVATRARLTAGVAQTEALAAEETLTINGVTIALTSGMTQSEVVEAINAAQAQTGITAAATGSDGEGVGSYLTLARAAYGAAFHVSASSTVSNQGGPGSSGLGSTLVSDGSPVGESGTGTGAAGVDIEGTIGGYAGTGAGRRLKVDEGEAKGLAMLVAATAPGSYGSVTFSVGAAEAAFRVALGATDSIGGSIARAQDYLGDSIGDIEAEITRIQTLVEQEHERLKVTFVAMERALARFQSQSQFLASHLAQASANSK